MAGGLSAVATLHDLLQAGRTPTVDERAELQKFPGWGASAGLFDPKNEKFAEDREFLESVWTKQEWEAARLTILNAHYTNPAYVEGMWKALGTLGVPEHAEILEPGCGTGNFLVAAPATARLTGVELDPTTAKIAGMLHPDANIRNESFADTFLDHDGFDAVIGNVPFADFSLHDPAYNKAGLSLHNHFIVKSLRMTKPGGVVSVMTSRWTLDGKSERARREIAKYGEFLGAVRMPAGAHGETAGTEAIVDTVVFRRYLPDEAPNFDADWLHTVDLDHAGEPVAVNKYFADHPDMVLGSTETRLGRFGPELTVNAPSTAATVIAPQFEGALQRIALKANLSGKSWDASGRVVTDRPAARITQDSKRLVGRVYVADSGEIEMMGPAGAEPVKAPKNARAELAALVALRDAAVRLLEAEATTLEDTPETVELRAELNRVYDHQVATYGALGRFTETVRERVDKEPFITRRYPPALKAMRTDPHFATLVALERFNEDTGEARKATIFTERVVGVTPLIDRVESPDDAIRISLDRTGTVDQQLVGELLNLRDAEVESVLGDRVYRVPDGRFSPAAEFLSGNVRQRLTEYRELSEQDPQYARHVAALEKVQPEELGPESISVRFGAAWLPTATVGGFIRRELGKELRDIERLNGEWKFQLRGKTTDSAEAKWAVAGQRGSWNARKLFDAVMNNKRLQVTYTDDDNKTLVDQEATEVLQERAAELHEAFQDWLWTDAERAESHQKIYNDLYNGIVLRSYDDVRLTFPGKAATFTPHPHQHAAVARMLAEPAAGLFHEVGAGKTAEMVMGVMELKRLGLVNKPAILVPNQMLEQFTREFKQIYPRAQVLSAGSGDVSGTNGAAARKLFVHRAKANDWDAVIMTHTAFEAVGLGESKQIFAQEKLTELNEAHEAIAASNMSNKSVKSIESDRKRLEEKLKKMLDFEQDYGVSWEETGIDYLCVDELHLFKNLTVTSRVDDLKKTEGSNRAQDLEMKLWYHRDHMKQSRVITGATATPLPNSMIEMFVMMRYLRPDLLQDANVYHADDWATQFTEQVTAVEPKPGGGGFHVKTRTAKFRNLPELLNMWHVAGDVKTQADLQLKVPAFQPDSDGRAAPEMVVVPATEAQSQGINDLIERAELVRNRMVQPEDDNMLKITSDGRAIALDARQRAMGAPEPGETTKIDAVADRVHTIWDDHKEYTYLDEWGEVSDAPGAFQIVFADLGTPKEHGWNVYDELRDQLVTKGMPREKISFVHEAANDKTKAELFQRCRDGRISVLIGSTEKMGVGTNVQARAIALHHVDAPWRPADVTQREGRIIRQGNQNENVRVLRYSTEGSFDSYMWGTLARKASFIEQVLSGRLDVREVDNSSEMALQFSEMQAITLGDMRILEIANLKQDVQRLSRQERGHARKIDSARSRRYVQEGVASMLGRDATTLETLLPKIVDTHGDAFTSSIARTKYDPPTTLRERKDFGERLRDLVAAAHSNLGYGFGSHNMTYPKPINVAVTVGGLTWSTALRWNPTVKADPGVVFTLEDGIDLLQVEMKLSRLTTGESATVARTFESRLRSAPAKLEETVVQRIKVNEQVEELRMIEAEQWPHKDELRQKRDRMTELMTELESEANKENVAPEVAQDAAYSQSSPSAPLDAHSNVQIIHVKQ